ncbi:MAG: helix-turn-helix transcriptional regulator [Anaerolinea sp.]|nr:helix-turn-helix transcriptional regulator [Anaerolinea sp.]
MQADNWMKKRREALGITQDGFAERLAQGGIHVTKAAISKWEMGKTPLPLQTPENRSAIAAALELTIPELLACAGYEIGMEWSVQARVVASLFDKLTKADQDTVYLLLTHLRRKDAAPLDLDDHHTLDHRAG